MGKILKIWKIDESDARLEKKTEDNNISKLFKRILDPKRFRKDIGIKETPGEVKFDSSKWRLIDRIRLEEEQNRNDL